MKRTVAFLLVNEQAVAAQQKEQPASPSTDDLSGALMQHPAQQKGSN